MARLSETYVPAVIEPYWQAHWERHHSFAVSNPSSESPALPKYYVLDMFPYPSSAGLHVGHPAGYTASDIVARAKRAQGFQVLHAMGWDAFGLPAEQFALKTGVHPAITTQAAIATYQRQLKALGFSFDWSRELASHDPRYYRWTQWIFLKLLEMGLAYRKDVAVNWCPALKTVLANEEVVEGRSERGGHPVERVLKPQWMLKITAYADRLLEGLDKLDWPESTKELQRNWIGKSEGLELEFGGATPITVFTTRADTIFGVSFLVIAPEHPQVGALTIAEQAASVGEYVSRAARKSDLERQSDRGEPTGCFTGSWAIHPITQQSIPIYLADYVLPHYGTGAVMGVPAHDERDFAFAQSNQIPILTVIVPHDDPSLGAPEQPLRAPFVEEGICVRSRWLDALLSAPAREQVAQWAEREGKGRRVVRYRLRDWLFSRQRYWGEPLPIVHYEDGSIAGVNPESLPVELPQIEHYAPTDDGRSPLASVASWVEGIDPRLGLRFRRETDTMPGSAASSWYFLRFCDPLNPRAPFSFGAQHYWMPVDLYVGGAEHAVGHLLYARFWTKVLHDLGLVSVDEPFRKLIHQGMILGEDGEKMSKSAGNVVNPDTVVAQYGADTLRLYEMFLGPLDRDKPWSTQAIEGVFRYLTRTYRIFQQCLASSDPPRALKPADQRIYHQSLKKITSDIELYKFNTAISQLMVWTNHLTQALQADPAPYPRTYLQGYIGVLHPFAPHLAEELWRACTSANGDEDHPSPLSQTAWPKFDPEWVREELHSIGIQVMGKMRARLEIVEGTPQSALEDEARLAVARFLVNHRVERVIYVPGRMLNFIIRPEGDTSP